MSSDELAEEIGKIWTEVLDGDAPTLDSNFFDAGGSSYGVVEICAKLKERLGYVVDLSHIMRAPTIRAMVAMIRGATPNEKNSVVPLQVNSGLPGVYCVHPIGGSAVRYLALGRSLAGVRDVYGLQPAAFAGGKAIPDTVPAIASEYVSQVSQQEQSMAAATFLGYSFGGLVAVEMARQAAGLEGRFPAVVMIDTGIDYGDVDWTTYPYRVLIHYTLGLDMKIEGLCGLDITSALQEIKKTAVAAGVLAEGDHSDSMRQIYDVISANCRAAVAYRPEAYAGPVLLFRSNERSDAGTDLGWHEFMPALEISEIESDHVGMLSLGGVEQITPVLMRHLGEPNGPAGDSARGMTGVRY